MVYLGLTYLDVKVLDLSTAKKRFECEFMRYFWPHLKFPQRKAHCHILILRDSFCKIMVEICTQKNTPCQDECFT